jgi:hypothetical protein
MSKLILTVALIFQMAGCGTLMHPERKGQRGGDIDVGIAILDGLGLLLFIIPGVIAFAVDFSNGTIYLPPGRRSTSYRANDLRRIRFDPARTRTVDIEALISSETGRTIKLAGAQVSELHSLHEMIARFAEDQDVRLASVQP